MEKNNEKEILANWPSVLKKLRLTKDGGLKQDNVANEVKLHVSSYNQLEKGKRLLYLPEMIRIANFYDMKLSDFAALIQRSPAELDKISQLQAELDESLKQNAWLKQ